MYATSFDRFDWLSSPYFSVIDIDRENLYDTTYYVIVPLTSFTCFHNGRLRWAEKRYALVLQVLVV